MGNQSDKASLNEVQKELNGLFQTEDKLEGCIKASM